MGLIKKLLCNNISDSVDDKEVAVLLSGGVDSISVAFAADYVGKDITAYSFQLDTHPSYDYQMAKKIAEIFSWKFVGITIPTINLEQDFRTLAQFCDKKTHYECVYPFLYVYPKIQEKYVLSGWAADGYYGVSKKAALHYKKPKSKFDEFRNNYFQPENQAGYKWHKKISDNYSKTLVTPYLRDNVKEYFYKFDWYELNKPYQKHHVRNAFPEFTEIPKVKQHLNLQLDSGISKLFETLIDNPQINFKRRSRVMDICRDWKMLYTEARTTLDTFL